MKVIVVLMVMLAIGGCTFLICTYIHDLAQPPGTPKKKSYAYRGGDEEEVTPIPVIDSAKK